ncbi:MAG TPA: zinc-dependent metalloprotease [Terracidiphilus sp.]|nr:zinc-dependent metalloprotease [Terracidiphilus sp.]
MLRPARHLAVVLLLALPLALLLAFATPARAADAATPTIAAKVAGMEHKDGLFPLDWDAKTGKLYLEIPHLDTDFLLIDQLPYGIGSNDIGLDRGQLGEGRVVHFSRVGGKVLLIQPNLRYRSSSPDPAQRLAVKQSFAESVLWGFPIVAVQDGRILVDATDFFLRDAHGVAGTLKAAGQGVYKLDLSRSALAMDNTKDFPENTEVEAMLTFTNADPEHSMLVASVTPDAHDVTVREHTSMIELPGPGYTPRRADPRAGFFSIDYRDYAAPLGQPLDQRLIIRHRLIKKDPNAAVSEPVKPIIYYVDRGAPEPIRSALVEGANWWEKAFEAAGFKNAFKVEVLPKGADPMDIRYNMIQWVHRSTRGWSYGASVVDPRTGEIIKGQVTLGSLRARQDYMIAEALLAPYMEGKPIPKDMLQMVLARTRQLAAHETGHTLGLAHNFAASSISQGDSVMDYPQPLVTLDANGKPDLSHAYAVGIGAWDKAAIRYGYSQFPPGTDVHQALDNILEQDQKEGLRFLSDADARPLGSASPYANLWDNGPDAPNELLRLLAVRKAALARFGVDAIQPGQPMAQLEDTLVPLYLLHRFQTEAAAKSIGGLDYRYAVRGGGGFVTRFVPYAEEKKALDAVLQTLDPAALTLPESLLQMLPPRPPGDRRTRESFGAHTGLAFDAESPVEAAAGITASLLFDPSRASRLVEYHARDAKQMGLEEELDSTLKATWYAPRKTGLEEQTQFTVENVVLRYLMRLAGGGSGGTSLGAALPAGMSVPGGRSGAASGEACAVALAEVNKLEDWLKNVKPADDTAEFAAHREAALAEIELFRKDPAKFAPAPALPTPPGQPIGSMENDAIIE